MEVIGSAARDDVDHASAGASDFSRESVGIHLKFLYRTLAECRRSKTGSACRLTKEQIVRIRAVHQHRIAWTALATKSEVAATCWIFDDTGSQHREIDKVSSVHRQVHNGLRIDSRCDIRSRCLDHRNFRGNRYCFCYPTDLQPCVHRYHGTDC